MKQRFGTYALTLVVGALLCLPLHADEASKQAKIQELFTLMHLEQNFSKLIDQQFMQGAQTAKAMFPTARPTAAQQQVIDSNLNKMRSVLLEDLSWAKLEPDFAKLYSDNYSEATVDGLLIFYRSPTGQELLAKQPTIVAQSGALMQRRLVDIMPQVQDVMKNMAEEMKRVTPPSK